MNVQKAHLLRCCAYNLGLAMRKCFGMGKPRGGGAVGATVFLLLATTAYVVSGSNAALGYLPWMLLGAQMLLLMGALMAYTTRLPRLIPENRGS